MTWMQVALVVPAGFFVWTLVRDFLAGLGEDRLWSDPEADESPTYAPTPEWEPISCKVYDFRLPRERASGFSHLPLDREA